MTIITINNILTVFLWGILISNILTAIVMQITLLILQIKRGDLDVNVKLRYRVGIAVHLAWALLAYHLILR